MRICSSGEIYVLLNFPTDSITSLMATTLYQWYVNRKHKLWNDVSTTRYILYMQVMLECCYKWRKFIMPYSFVPNRPSLSITRNRSSYEGNMAVSKITSYFKSIGKDAIYIMFKLRIVQRIALRILMDVFDCIWKVIKR